jgi:hypothetical protein
MLLFKTNSFYSTNSFLALKKYSILRRLLRRVSRSESSFKYKINKILKLFNKKKLLKFTKFLFKNKKYLLNLFNHFVSTSVTSNFFLTLKSKFNKKITFTKKLYKTQSRYFRKLKRFAIRIKIAFYDKKKKRPFTTIKFRVCRRVNFFFAQQYDLQILSKLRQRSAPIQTIYVNFKTPQNYLT